MDGNTERERATQPEDLSRFFVARANGSDVATVCCALPARGDAGRPNGEVMTGSRAIRRAYEGLLAEPPTFTPTSSPGCSTGIEWQDTRVLL